MSERPMANDAFDELMTSWLDGRAQVPVPDDLLQRSLVRTAGSRPIPALLLPERWMGLDALARRRQRPRLALAFVVIALSLILAALAILEVGSQRLPPPFGIAAPGLVSYVADSNLWVAEPDGANARQLTTDPRIDLFPVWSRDGTKIVLKRLPVEGSDPDWAAKGDIIVVDLATGTEVLIDADTRSPSPFSWSPDSRAVAYSRDSRPSDYSGPLDGTQDQVYIGRLDGSPSTQVTRGALAGWAPAWGPNDLIAFVRGYPTIDGIWVTRPDGSGQRTLTRGLIENFDLMDWSPDGTKIVYSMYSAAMGVNRSIWSISLDEQGETLLTSGWMPAVSPDGRRITFLRGGVGAGQTRIYVANADGTGAREISDDGIWQAPQWSPDGTRIVGMDGRAGQPPLVVILDPDRLEPATSFELPSGEGLGRADAPSWQRLAPRP